MRCARHLLLAHLLCAPTTFSLTATWSNVAMRKDTRGLPVNAHSGNLYRFGPLFYLYGTAYQNCTQSGAICEQSCGFFHNRFVVYTSPDLAAWTLLSDNLVPAMNRDAGTVEYDEVNVGFNEAAQEFVLSFWSGSNEFHNSVVPLARSPTPGGPFLLAPPAKMQGASVISDTIALFVDDDNTAYLRYNTRDLPYRHIVEKLDPTWHNSTGEFAEVCVCYFLRKGRPPLPLAAHAPAPPPTAQVLQAGLPVVRRRRHVSPRQRVLRDAGL